MCVVCIFTYACVLCVLCIFNYACVLCVYLLMHVCCVCCVYLTMHVCCVYIYLCMCVLCVYLTMHVCCVVLCVYLLMHVLCCVLCVVCVCSVEVDEYSKNTSLRYYQTVFETPFLAETKEYYLHVASKLVRQLFTYTVTRMHFIVVYTYNHLLCSLTHGILYVRLSSFDM